jgi:Amt family ammonium transporter
MKLYQKITLAGVLGLSAMAGADVALAQDAAPAVSPETKYVFNTLLFLIGGFLVMFMAAGFAMLEAGLVRSKNVPCSVSRTSRCTRLRASCSGSAATR